VVWLQIYWLDFLKSWHFSPFSEINTKKPLHDNRITVISLYVAPPDGLEPNYFSIGRKTNPDIKTTPIKV